ncbi:MAG: glycoside hydrolase family 3 C-terminal domain-containing protein [Bacteroidota bacterium]|nr:glycoside hydrolase family 3 C-terminal domain-containing protein [Bacteroidota bacterium]
MSTLFLNQVFGQSSPLYLDENASQNERINDLLNRLTVEEKVSLLIASSPGIPRLNIDKYYHGNEALHGVVRPGKFTVFPQAIGLASMWNPGLQFKIATAISDEARGRWNELEQGKKQKEPFNDLLTFWSPVVNMARDQRWGRTGETYGEDPYLSSVLGVQFVKGLQGDDPKYLKVVATPKHFVAYNKERDRYSNNALVPMRSLREYYFPAFKACIQEGKAAAIMSSYNAVNGVPCTANTWLLTKVLRDEWGFKGYVVSDCGAPDHLIDGHHYVKTKELAAMVSIKAGLDLECGDDIYTQPLMNAYKSGMVSETDIDTAAYRILRARMELGLFDNSKENPYNKILPSVIGDAEHKALALEAAKESIVLLKNKNHTLPVNLKRIKSIAVVGINAANTEFGAYSGMPAGKPVSLLEGIQNRVGKKVKIVYAPWKPVNGLEGFQLISKDFFPDGLRAEYYTNMDLDGKPKIRRESNINFDPSNQAPDPFIPNSPFSVRWVGKIKPSISGKYSFGLLAHDGSRLIINGKTLIDSWRNKSLITDVAETTLEAGNEYNIEVDNFNHARKATAKLFWKGPDEQKNFTDLFKGAVQSAKNCDMTVAVLAVNYDFQREGQDGESIRLSKDQEEFIKEIYRANPNTIVVLESGNSIAINWINDSIPAILDAWYPGQEGGTAVAEVLFGDYNPAGRLPLTFYRSLDDLPSMDDYDITKGRTYQYYKGKPLYPFGYGLSYTTFTYSNLQVKDIGSKLQVSYTVKNVGKTDGDEVTQVYVKLPDLDIPTPIKQLKGFDRVYVLHGKTVSVQVEIEKSQLNYWDEKQDKFITPKGTYDIMVGASSEDIRLKQKLEL